MQKSNRKTYIDTLRVFAAFFVVFIHTPGFTLYQSSDGIKTWLYAAISIIAKSSVPLFFMITGTLLLGKEESIGIILRKRFSRIIAVLFLFSGLLYLITLPSGTPVSISAFLRQILSESVPQAWSYWFLYAYLGFLLLLPFLRRMVKGMTKQDFWYFAILHALFCSALPVLNYILACMGQEALTVAPHLQIPLMLESAFFYPIAGYYLDQKVDIERFKKKHLLLLLLCLPLCLLLSCSLTVHQGYHFGYTQSFLVLFDYVLAFILFLLCKHLFVIQGFLKNSNSIQKAITFVGQLTLGMYLMDPIWKWYVYGHIRDAIASHLPVLIFSLIWCIVSMALSSFATFLLKKIPGLKSLL